MWVGDEQIVPQPGSLAQDLDYWWRAFTIPSVVHAQPFRAQEEIVPQPAASLVHEEDGAPLATSGDEATFTVWAEDEQVALSNGGFLEADYWWTAKPVLLDPAAQPITDDPLIVPQPLPLGVDVDPWTPPTVITPVPVLWPTLPWVAEQNEGIEFIAPPAPVVDDRAAKWKRRRDREEVYEEAPKPPEAPEPPKTVKPADPVRKTSKGDLLRAVRALAQQQRELVTVPLRRITDEEFWRVVRSHTDMRPVPHNSKTLRRTVTTTEEMLCRKLECGHWTPSRSVEPGQQKCMCFDCDDAEKSPTAQKSKTAR